MDAVTLMVQLSGIVATVATLIAGTLSDKLGNRKKFIAYGYMIWGVTVALFGMISPDWIGNLFGVSADTAIQIALVVAAVGYTWVFLGLGIVIVACGAGGLFLVQDSPYLEKKGGFKDILYGFKPNVIKHNKSLYLNLAIVGVYGVACQIFMPYIIIYMKTYLHFTVIEYSIVFGIAILAGAALNIWFGRIADKMNKAKLLYIATAIFSVGLLGMWLSNFESHIANLIVFGAFGFVMITGYILVSALTGALTRDYTPEQEAGKMQGVRMIFSVFIPMILGPMIGNAINKAANIPLENAGADVMTTAYVPAPEIFLVGGLVALLMYALIPLLVKVIEKEKN